MSGCWPDLTVLETCSDTRSWRIPNPESSGVSGSRSRHTRPTLAHKILPLFRDKVQVYIVKTMNKAIVWPDLTEEQYGFRSSRGTTGAVFVVRQIIEKARERRIKLHWNFVDFKAAFDTIWREALWKCLRSIGVDQVLVDLIKTCTNKQNVLWW